MCIIDIMSVFYWSIHKRFAELDPEAVERDKNAKLSKERIITLPELRVSYGYRILVYSLLLIDWLSLDLALWQHV